MGDKIRVPLSICATTGSKLSDLVIKDGQMIFVQDKRKIAFDFGGKRVFYNQITELSTDEERLALSSPDNGYYFVVNTAILWAYQGEWIPLNSTPSSILCIATELPELGSANKLYVDKTGGISIWDDNTSNYIHVADKSGSISTSDIESLFI